MLAGFFVSPARLAKFILSLNRVIDTASVTTGRLILKGWRWHFSKWLVCS